MRKNFLLTLVVLTAVTSISVVRAEDPDVQITPDNVKWARFAGYSDNVEVATLYGAVNKSGIYTLRVKMSKGAKLKIHTHPDTRMITVLSGTLYAGRGTSYDAATEVAFSAGDFFVVPAGAPHYTRVGDEEVIYQENGFGPSPTILPP